MKTAVVYIRLSPKNRGDESKFYDNGGVYYGDDAQLEACRAWAAANDVEIVGIHRDIDVSGAAPLAQRLGLTSAIEDVRDKGATYLLVGKRDRLARETLNALIIERDLAKVGARVVQANGMNEDTAEAKMIRVILDAVSEYEREIGRARTKAALQAKKARGEFLGRPPRGYAIEAGKLVKLPPEPGASGYDWTAVSNARRESRRAALARAGRKANTSANEALARNRWAASMIPGAS